MLSRRLLCVCLTLSFLVVLLPTASADYERDWNLEIGKAGFVAIGQPSTESVPYQKHDKAYATVDFGNFRGDVYIMKCNEFYNLEDGEPFKYAAAKENVTGKVKIEHVKEDDRYEVYCLVVDNMDNARSSDAVPTHYISVHASFNWDDGHIKWYFYKLIAIGAVISIAMFAGVFVFWKMKS